MNPPRLNPNTDLKSAASIGSPSSPLAKNPENSTSSSTGSSLTSEDLQENGWLARVTDEKNRLRKCILSLRTQVKNPVIMDQFLCCLSTVTAIDGRLPFTPKRVVTTQDKLMLIHNLIAKSIIDWGVMARKEWAEPDPISIHLVELERIVGIGFDKIFAYPKDRNSAIYVLRTFAEEKE